MEPKQPSTPAYVVAMMKHHFFAGLLVVIPLGVIAWLVLIALNALWRLHELLPESWRPQSTLVNAGFTIGTALILAIGISALGFVSKLYLGRKILQLISHLIRRIPVIRGVYSSLDQLLRTVAAGGGKQFSRVVYLEYPRKGTWVIAFVTGPARGAAVPPQHLNVYVPTTPNPTSGFHLIVPESEVRDAQMKVDEAFKALLSLGIAQGPAAENPVR